MATQSTRPRFNHPPPPPHLASPRCAICSRPEQVDKILIPCGRCKRSYHPSCHRPLPKRPFTCFSCQRRVPPSFTKQALPVNNGTTPKTTTPTSGTSFQHPAKMALSASNANPFLLSDSEDDSYWARTKCRVPNCNQDAIKGNVACLHHLNAISPRSMNGHVAKPPQQGFIGKIVRTASEQSLNGKSVRAPSEQSFKSNSIRTVSEQSLPSDRKILEAKSTARKSVTKRYHPNQPIDKPSAQDGSLGNKTSTNVHVPAPMSVQRLLNKPSQSPEGPAKKKQRITPPRAEAYGLNHAASSQPLFASRGFVYNKQNGGMSTALGQRLKSDRISPPPLARASARTEQTQEKQVAGPPTFNDRSKAPTNSSSTENRLKLSKPKEEPNAVAGETQPNTSGPNKSLEIPKKNPLPPKQTIQTNVLKQNATQPTSTELKADRVVNSAPRLSKHTPTTSVPLLERQRLLLVEKRDTSILDSFIYGQPGSSQLLPPGVQRPSNRPEPRKQPKVLMAHIDPRIHRTRPHSAAWYRKKEEEIKKRGGRKANFGKASQRLKQQRAQQNPDEFEASLPDRVRSNEDWVKALHWFQHGTRNATKEPSVTPAASPARFKRPSSRQKPATLSTPQRRFMADSQ